MNAAGKFRGFPQPKSFFGKSTLKECTSGNVENVVLIDVDCDKFHNVIILDLPESLEQKLRKKSPCTVISIDDEEENTSGTGGDTDATSSNGGFPVSASPNSIDLDGEDCLFVSEETSPVNLSKFKRTYSGKTGSRNCYGLGSGFESDSSEGDCSDCEVMEGSSGRLREQWEQASKRKNQACDGQSGFENQTGPSASDAGSQRDLGGRVNTSSSTFCTDDNEGLSSFAADGDDNLGNYFFNQGIDDNEARQTTFSEAETNVKEAETRSTEDNLFTDSGVPLDKYFDYGCHPFSNKEQVAGEPSMPSNLEKDDDKFNPEKPSPQDLGHNTVAEPCLYNRQPSFDEHFDFSKPDDELYTCKHPGDCQADHDNVASGSRDEALLHACSTPLPHEQTKFKSQVNLTSEECSFPNFELYSDGAKSVVGGEKVSHKEVRNSLYEESLCGSRCSETESVFCHSSAMEVEEPLPMPSSENAKLDEKSDASSPGVGAQSTQDDVITDRQKIKETDEYKRAMEEEWACRQRQLQIQAEEAQRLRRRRRAESMRIMDMERRQKQRLEEMRETQKKDKENMNLKEQLRAEVRKELNILELTCGDMASLLRSLGIHVEGGFLPSPHEVQAAYKRALLKFHPDRASRTDLQRQVEAEETFKLISRMKEKFLLP
ncbi:hypothetical protein Ancab_018673 [Ancistrocladus abbreviatus]